MKLIRNKKKSKQTEEIQLPPWKILIVDDEADIHAMTRLALLKFEFSGKKLQIFQAMSGIEAREILAAESDIAVALIDVVMETDDAGLKLVEFIRQELKNSLIRLIIRTGQAGKFPETTVVERYDINDFKDKTELTSDRLYTTIRLALKSYQDLNTLNINRKGLQFILDLAKDLYQPHQSINSLYDLILKQIFHLYQLSENNRDSGMLIISTDDGVEVQAARGRFAKGDKEVQAIVQEAILAKNANPSVPANVTLIPLETSEKIIGFICLENALHSFQEEKELIYIMAKECAIALQLAAAREKISALNERLKAENVRMSSELDVAHKLQQMVLPSEAELREIAGLDVAAFMEPAEEVGGDYYDIIQYKEHIIFGIGDVTGHGLESGVLMLMVQAAVRSLLDSGITDYNHFLNSLNSTIYHNVQRMNNDKFITLSLVDYQPQRSQGLGLLRLIGQHEEVLLVRQNGKLERVNTLDLGFPIGMVPDISTFMSPKVLELRPGDGVVLHTDGITEAINQDKVEYGIERLCEVITRNWHLSASEIQQAVIADVKQYIGAEKVYDDIALVVFKQKQF
ncbi:MAG: SpoIIE family protein phosphatase [Pseudomonadota bacterium]